ncbi:hypothetical protein H6G76_34035 [Nostoc sp. FACHB-152]|uniref:hypothetical protein n=1 Tax=Nostoc sp. FACHB-152 TaxID=2692837 RepID=UPI0016868930|nr:hypothetical protein [Nostoc sp. FACHB-152]MBD2452047.1 hypothetical protein [Nostoc sp. FACHB-152]
MIFSTISTLLSALDANGTKITPNPLPIRMSGCGVSGVGCSEEGKYLCSYSIFGFLNLPLHPTPHTQHPAYTSFQLFLVPFALEAIAYCLLPDYKGMFSNQTGLLYISHSNLQART